MAENRTIDPKQRQREAKARWAKKNRESSREIGTPKAVANRPRRRRALQDPVFFLKTYFPGAFTLEFSADHLDAIATLQHVATSGGLFALAMPRGSGKTQISIRMVLWALLGGHRRFAAIVGSTEKAAKNIIEAIKKELTFNPLLNADFPKEIHGFKQLQGDSHGAVGQISKGARTQIGISTEQILFPMIPGSKCAGSVISACGITGNVRGQFHTLSTGEILRPDMAILDDPQTKESAKSSIQTQERLETVEGDVLGLAGPDVQIAAVMPCTVIAPDDLTERVLKNPLWNGKRTKTLNRFPDNMALVDEYLAERREGLRVDRSSDRGMKFYRQRQSEIEAGAEAAWPARILTGDISAIQSALHLWDRSPSAFAAEYQNEPIDQAANEDRPRCKGLEQKLLGKSLPRGTVPAWATHLTAGIDSQLRLLYFTVIAWKDDFTGAVIDYGAFPDQRRLFYTLSDASPTLQEASGIPEMQGSVWWGLKHLTERLCEREWPIEGGNGHLKLERCLIDVGWGECTELAYRFLRQSPHAAVLMPSKGKGITAGLKPMDEWPKKTGERHGLHWVQSSADNHHRIRRVTHDANWWKTFLAGRCSAPEGNPGSLSVFGEKPEQHRMLAAHLAAESCVKTFGNGREVWEWHLKPGEDNHLLDAMVMASVGASISGVSLERLRLDTKKPKRSMSEILASRR